MWDAFPNILVPFFGRQKRPSVLTCELRDLRRPPGDPGARRGAGDQRWQALQQALSGASDGSGLNLRDDPNEQQIITDR